ETFKIRGNSFIEGLKILHEEGGDAVWTLTARKADLRESDNMADLSDITVVVPKNGLRLYADKGVYDLTNQKFTTESVIKAEAKDYKITTSLLNYEASSGKIKTEEMIKVDGKRFKVEGKGMTVDSERKVRILKDVKATFYK
ncbi:MAG TPA: LPS export ABC transporter periplasmic protein LptC, partial [Thermodesulfovibrionales bacterium]|nr:LPS export ABC transporter periplasmic protein LptC [Thermodesulfovibrionales bacterium]